MGLEDAIKPGDEGPELYGVRGWLLFLCLYLTVLIPLLTLVGLFAVWRSAAASAMLHSALVIEIVIEIALAAFAFYAGWVLFRLRPNAVTVAKIYFIATLTLGVLGLFMVLLGSLSQFSDPVVAGMLRGPAAFAAGRQILVSFLWLLYLERSRRVRETYAPG